MKSVDFWRNLYHPTYGNYGGVKNSGNGYILPEIDELDAVFKTHDLTLFYNSDLIYRIEADNALLESLYKIKVKNLARPIYGFFYKNSCILIFGLVKMLRRK